MHLNAAILKKMFFFRRCGRRVRVRNGWWAKRSLEPMRRHEEAGQGGLSRSGVPWGMDGFLKENDKLARSTRFNPLQPALILFATKRGLEPVWEMEYWSVGRMRNVTGCYALLRDVTRKFTKVLTDQGLGYSMLRIVTG